tara:strand:+ start:2812 stop:3108 length:297 start_codon:yes stop_codon:yes gene_type:complete
MSNFGIYFGRPSTIHKLTSGSSSSATSNAFGNTTSVIMLVARTHGCHFKIGATPTASTSTSYLPKDEVIYVKVSGGADKIAVIREHNADGEVYATELI